jgi:hypothetical protein
MAHTCCMLDKATRMKAQAHACARTHTDRQICNTYCFSMATVGS